MGLDTKIVDLPFNVVLAGGGGQFDLAIAATTITPARAKKVDFSDPYFNAAQGLLVQQGSDIQSVDDLSGKIVGAQDATTGETYAQDNTDASEVRPFPQIDQAYNALKVGQVDAVINDLPSVNDAAEQIPAGSKSSRTSRPTSSTGSSSRRVRPRSSTPSTRRSRTSRTTGR